MIATMPEPPARSPLGWPKRKNYPRIAGDGQDGLVGELIAAARSRVEELSGVAMITRSLRLTLDWWPQGTADRRWMPLPVRPSGALNAGRIYNGAGVASDVTSRFTFPAGRAAKLMWTDGAFLWPGLRAGGIEIDYAAGFGDTPQDVAEGLRLAAYAYNARDPETIAGPLPVDVAGLLSPWRRGRL